MERIVLATDAILGTLIGREDALGNRLIERAQSGEVQLIVPHRALYCAVFSVKEGDRINSQRFATLLQFAEVSSDEPEYLGSSERVAWKPTEEEVANWRKYAQE